MTNIDMIGAVLISTVVSLIATWLMIKIAKKLNIVDHPSAKKVHLSPTPLLGGVAIYYSFIVALFLTIKTDKMLIGILVGGTVLMIVGIIDDKFGMLPRVKLTGQIIAAVITVIFGSSLASLNTVCEKTSL